MYPHFVIKENLNLNNNTGNTREGNKVPSAEKPTSKAPNQQETSIV